MENNDSNSKSPQTGGLKLMTVFIAVLALHVVVIGGFTVYHLMSGGSTDADLVTLDKSHKDAKSGDATTASNGSTPDASQTDKTAAADSTATPPTDTASTSGSTTAPASASPAVTTPAPVASTTPVATTTSDAATSAPIQTPAPTPLLAAPPQLTLAPPANVANSSTLTPLTPSADLSSAATSNTPSGPIGPVHMPPATVAPSPSHTEGQGTYTVKITDSYLKIAKSHHVTVAQLKEANHIKGDTLHTGQKLIIPSGKTMVAKADSVKVVPTSSTSVLSQAPVLRTAVLTSTSPTRTSSGMHEHTYTIVKGDTLTKIAHKFKTTTAAIISANDIADPTKLSIGKKLKIPSRESRSAVNSLPFPTQPSEVKTETVRPTRNIAPAEEVQPTDNAAPQGDLATFTP